MKFLRLFSVLAALLASSCASHQPDLKLVSHVDLPRYMGPWYVIGHMDTRLERGFTAEVDSYQLHPDHANLDVTFTYRKDSLDAPLQTKHFKAKIVNTETNSSWKVYMFPPFGADYQIMALSPDYQWSALGHPTRKYGWVLSRKPQMPEAQYQKILGLFREQGYDTSKFVRVPQPKK